MRGRAYDFLGSFHCGGADGRRADDENNQHIYAIFWGIMRFRCCAGLMKEGQSHHREVALRLYLGEQAYAAWG